jgi:hypothetical protein
MFPEHIIIEKNETGPSPEVHASTVLLDLQKYELNKLLFLIKYPTLSILYSNTKWAKTIFLAS